MTSAYLTGYLTTDHTMECTMVHVPLVENGGKLSAKRRCSIAFHCTRGIY
jgi:hypothetical protein